MSQPLPKKNNHPAVWDLVIEDMKARDEAGQKTYGVRLQPFNGRSFLWDAYEEILDLAVYIRGKIYEEESKAEVVDLETFEGRALCSRHLSYEKDENGQCYYCREDYK